jgi:hypothetical protein
MNSALRPMSTGEVLDRTFNLYRNHFLLFAGIAVGQAACILVGIVLIIPLGAIFSLGRLDSLDPLTIIATFGVYSLVIFLFFLIGYAMATGAATFAVARLHLGYTATIRDSYREVRPMIWRTMRIVISLYLRFLGALILTEVVTVVGVSAILPALAKAVGGSPPLIFRWIIGIVILGFFVAGAVWATRIYCRYALAVPACLLEKLPARQALKRSKWLSRGGLGRIFLVFFLMGMLALGLSYAIQFPIALLAERYPGVISLVLELMGAFLALTFALPTGTIAVCLVYYDQRVRKEAFDLQLMMDSLGQTASPPQVPAASPIA